LVLSSYSNALEKAQSLASALDELGTVPSTESFSRAKAAWLASRPDYLQTEAFRFYGGPIDDEDGPEGRINAWPMDEVYMDYVEGNPMGGIISNSTQYPDLAPDTLKALNLIGGEENIATGYHAIEFLLWGQDSSPTGPGARPLSDYLPAESPSAARRATYLRSLGQVLTSDLASVRDQWVDSGTTYRKAFAALPVKTAIGLILTGIGSLSGAELTHERLQVAYDTKSQEDEHSCFSDNTHVDHVNDELGIVNVYLGRIGDDDGPGLDDLVAARDPALDREMKERMLAAQQAIGSIPKPFDQALVGDDAAPGRIQIKAAIDALKAQTETLTKVAKILNVPLNLE